MAELDKFERQNQEAFAMVNENHQRALDDERTMGLSELKRIILRRISGLPEVFSKKTIIYFHNDNNVRYIIKSADGELIGTIGIGDIIKTKIELIAKRPVFIICRGNEIYLRKDILTDRIISQTENKSDYKEAISTSIAETPMYDGAKYIYELIEKEEYDVIDPYIADSLEQLIVENDMDSTQKEKREAYTQAYVIARNIYRTKTEMLERKKTNQPYDDLYKQLKVYYSQICQIFINVGLYEIPKIEEELITRG